MPWIRRSLRGAKIWARAREDGSLVVDGGGRVDIRYSRDEGAKVYRAAARNLERTGEPDEDRPEVELETGPTVHPADAIVIYTDGACSGNPGPMGIGIVVLDGDDRREVGAYLGEGTNNIAELTEADDLERGANVLLHMILDRAGQNRDR